MNTSVRSILCASLLANVPSIAQQASPPGEPIVPARESEERIDVTGDVIADLVIYTRLDHTPDPAQGLDGWYRRGVVTLPGTSILLSTAHQTRYHLLADTERLDTAILAKGFHYQQLQWSAADQPIEFRMLQQAFGPGIALEATGWYGTGMYHEGTMILRSTVGSTTRIAAFKLWFTLPSGRIGIDVVEVRTVPPDFGDQNDPPPTRPRGDDPFSLGIEKSDPQVVIPPGLPPDVPIDLVGDEGPEVILTGHEEHWHGEGRMGYYVRGLSPSQGTAFLMQRGPTGVLDFFRLGDEEALTPEHLTDGLQGGTLYWAYPEQESVFFPVLRHPFGMGNQPQEWSLVEEHATGDLVYRSIYYGREHVIGVVEVHAAVPGGELRVQAQNWVEEGQVLQVR